MMNPEIITNPDEKPVDQLTYDEAFSRLEAIVTAMEEDELALETAMQLFERGQKLVQRCNSLLEQAELRVRQLSGEDLAS